MASFFGKTNPVENNGVAPSQPPADQAPWMIAFAARTMGTISGGISIFCGFISLFSIFDTSCIVAGAMLIVEGLFLLMVEAPQFCTFIDIKYTPRGLFDGKPHWIKGTLYLLFAAIPFFWCFGMFSIFGSFFIFITSALYLLIALGKKASADEMKVAASHLSTSPKATLVTNEELPKYSPPGSTVIQMPSQSFPSQKPVY